MSEVVTVIYKTNKVQFICKDREQKKLIIDLVFGLQKGYWHEIEVLTNACTQQFNWEEHKKANEGRFTFLN